MRTHTFLLSLFLPFLALPLRGQVVMHGTVTDEHAAPLEFVNVVALTADTAFIAGTTSTSDGHFSLELPPEAQRAAWVRFSYVGYGDKLLPFGDGDMGTVALTPLTNQLAEATVTAQRPVYTLTPEGMTTKIPGTILANIGSANDVLSRLPGIEGRDGSFSVFGRGQAAIYINGRPMQNSFQLDQINSRDIESIEVIKNPGAKYDNAVRAVIRIQIKRKAGEGLSGMLRAGYSRTHYNSYSGQAYLNYRWRGLDVSATGHYKDSRSWMERWSRNDIHDRMTQESSASQKSHGTSPGGNLSVNYQISNTQSVGATYSLSSNEATARFPIRMHTDSRNAPSQQLFYEQMQKSRNKASHNVQGYYSGTFNKWQVNLDLNYVQRPSHQTEQASSEYGSDGTLYQQMNSFGETSNSMYAARLVVGYRLGPGLLNFGSEYTHTSRDNLFRNAQDVLPSADSRINESNASVFAEYNAMWGRWALSAGLRYQATLSDYYEQGVLIDAQSKDYHDLLATLTVGTRLGKLNLQLGYAARKIRPNYRSLRSEIQYVDRYSYNTGNPLLKAGVNHNVSLDANHGWLYFNVGYSRTKNGIIPFTEAYGQDAILERPVNLDRQEQVFAMLTAAPKIGFWQASYTVAFQKQFIDNEALGIQHSLGKPLWNVSLSNYFDLPWNMMLWVQYAFQSDCHMSNTLTKKISLMNIGATQYFLKRQLSLQVQVNPLRTTNKLWGYYQLNTFYKEEKSDAPSVSLTLRYTFNAAKSRYRGKEAGAEERKRL